MSTLGEGQFDDLLVGLTCTNDSIVRPDRSSSPFPIFDDVRVGFVNELSDKCELLSPRQSPSSRIRAVMSSEAASSSSIELGPMTFIHFLPFNKVYTDTLLWQPKQRGHGKSGQRTAFSPPSKGKSSKKTRRCWGSAPSPIRPATHTPPHVSVSLSVYPLNDISFPNLTG